METTKRQELRNKEADLKPRNYKWEGRSLHWEGVQAQKSKNNANFVEDLGFAMIRDNFLKQEYYVKCLYPDGKLCFNFVIVNVLCLVLQGKKNKK